MYGYENSKKKCIKKYRQDENGSLSIFILFASEAGKPTAAASATQIFLARFKQEALQFVPFSHFLGGSSLGSSKKNFKKGWTPFKINGKRKSWW